MADLLLFEFAGPDIDFDDVYHRVDARLGINPADGTGDWPAGLITHAAAIDGESFVVAEMWESRAAQEEFMNSRLAPALAAENVPPPDRMQWFGVIASYQS